MPFLEANLGPFFECFFGWFFGRFFNAIELPPVFYAKRAEIIEAMLPLDDLEVTNAGNGDVLLWNCAKLGVVTEPVANHLKEQLGHRVLGILPLEVGEHYNQQAVRPRFAALRFAKHGPSNLARYARSQTVALLPHYNKIWSQPTLPAKLATLAT